MTDISLKMPILPTKGDLAALIAPASAVTHQDLAVAVSSLKYIGLEPVVMRSCTMSYGYLSAPDQIRADDIMSAFKDDAIKAIFCIRGGYGSIRLLPLLDFQCIKKNPKVFLGSSDITAIHTMINRSCGFVTFHGPMPGMDYRCLDAPSLKSLEDAVFLGNTSRSLSMPKGSNSLISFHRGKASGILTGGNLSMLQSTLGSPYEIYTKNKILFIEETNESPYRIDRAITSLALAGKFKDCNGVLFGAFTNCSPNNTDLAFENSTSPTTYTLLKQILDQISDVEDKPVLAGIKAGHITSQLTLSLGKYVTLDGDSPSIIW